MSSSTLHHHHQQQPRTAQKSSKKFGIYIDHGNHQGHPISRRPFESPRTPTEKIQSIHKAKTVEPTTAKKSITNPLQDKTNTVKKNRTISKVRIDQENEKSASHKAINNSILKTKKQTPHMKKTAKIQSTQSDLLSDPVYKSYQTPATAKRARRPPNPAQSSLDDDHEGQADVSTPVDHSTHQLDFNPFELTDVEYGPPSAIIEPIEYPYEQDNNDLIEFFKTLKDPQSYLISSPGGIIDSTLDEEVNGVLAEDGRKDQWELEPSCPITNYQGDYFLDDLHLPPPTARLMSSKDLRKPKSSKSTLSLASSSLPSVRENFVHKSGSLASRSRPGVSLRPPQAPRVNSVTKSLRSKPSSLSSAVLAQGSTRAPHPVKHRNQHAAEPEQVARPPLSRYQELLQALILENKDQIAAELDKFLQPDDYASYIDAELEHFRLDI